MCVSVRSGDRWFSRPVSPLTVRDIVDGLCSALLRMSLDSRLIGELCFLGREGGGVMVAETSEGVGDLAQSNLGRLRRL